MSASLVAGLSNKPSIYVDEPFSASLLGEYKRVVLESLITSFGLDCLMGDRHGGDVDTIRNVRQVGADDRMTYKNKKNTENYENRGEYSHEDYHSDPRFASKKHEAREKYQSTGQGAKDAYTDGNLEHTTASEVPSDKRAELDHIVETKAIHDDRGRVLAGLNGVDLANATDNLAWTNKSLNASMGSWARHKNDKWRKEHGCDAPIDELDMRAYLREHPEIDEATQKRMLSQYDKARNAYEKEIARAYYTSKAFFSDSAKAAGKLGVKMGLKAVAGLIFAEVWFAVEDELKLLATFGKEIFNAVGRGIRKGFSKACKSYKALIDKFLGSSVAGVLSSLFTTVTNIFFTTAKSFVRIIRHTWSSLVEATRILLINPDCLPAGERIRSGVKIIATGASVISGIMVTEALNKTSVGAIPFVGDIISTFCGTFVTGVMSCALLYFLDHNGAINSIVKVLDTIPCIDNYVAYLKMQASVLDEYAAKLMDIDLSRFKKETSIFVEASVVLDDELSEHELNVRLLQIYDSIGVELPWRGHTSFNNFMNDKNVILTFK